MFMQLLYHKGLAEFIHSWITYDMVPWGERHILNRGMEVSRPIDSTHLKMTRMYKLTLMSPMQQKWGMA